MTQNVDVIVIGGGPAGSISAITLAQQGKSVLLLEREAFPRFHIGESMLPYLIGVLDRLGIRERVEAQGYVRKFGGEFIDPTEKKFFSGVYRADFSKQGTGRHSGTFQVERAKFDKVLLDLAGEAGATVLTEATVGDLITDGDRVVGVEYRHEGEAHEARAAFVVDASGRQGKIANTYQLRKVNEKLRMVAVFRRYGGLDERNNLGFEGDIQIGVHDDGWIWAIPLSEDEISVGTVMPRAVFRASTPEQVFTEHLARVPRITRRLAGTHPVFDVGVETDYCYHSDTVTGPGWAMVGDAGCFGDPMFSGGVLVASVTGMRAGQLIAAALDDPGNEAKYIEEYSNFFKTGYDTYIRLIHAFYQGELVAAVADAARATSRDDLESYIVRVIGGDFWSEHNPVARALRARPGWETFEPFERVLGCPVYPHLEAADRQDLLTARS